MQRQSLGHSVVAAFRGNHDEMGKVRIVIDKIPAWGCTIATVALILWLTLARHPFGGADLPLFPGADKIVHGIMFGWLSAMIVLDDVRKRRWKAPSLSFVMMAVAVSSSFGIGIEFLQEWMHLGRSFDPRDMVADAAGAVIAGIIWGCIIKSKVMINGE